MEPLLKNILDSWIAHCTEQLLHFRTKNNIQGIYKYTRRGWAYQDHIQQD